jgi:isopenicillin N synthase-like dioxygenase
MAALKIPVIDLAACTPGDAAAQRDVAHAFGEAFETVGFATVIHHGVAAEHVAQMYETAQAFFALPYADKLRHMAGEQAKGRGYLPIGIESVAATLTGQTPPDLCEALVFSSLQREARGAGKPNIWPAQPPLLARHVRTYFDDMLRLCHVLMRLSAQALALPIDYFAPYYSEPSLSLRFVCYPEQHSAPAQGQMRYGAHHDYGGLTILRQDAAPGGLQICDRDGVWHDVPPQPDGFVINVGDLISRWTGGRWRSTLHRVINPPTVLAGTRRLSMVAFTGPNDEAEVACLPTCLPADGRAPEAPVVAGDYIRGKLAASMDLDRAA